MPTEIMSAIGLMAPVRTAGCDEVGRGPLAGDVAAVFVLGFCRERLEFPRRVCLVRPQDIFLLAGDVVAAAVILGSSIPEELNDSKKLTERKRARLFDEIKASALAWSIGRASVEEIDRLNILNASLLAMTRAVESLSPLPDHVLVDGNKLPAWQFSAEAIVGGDGSIPCISAASVLAKVTRDREMVQLDEEYPGYGLAKHKGYPTAQHLSALVRLGVTPIHRRSFGPVARLI